MGSMASCCLRGDDEEQQNQTIPKKRQRSKIEAQMNGGSGQYRFRHAECGLDDTRLTSIPIVPMEGRKVRAVTDLQKRMEIEEEFKLDRHKINLSNTSFQPIQRLAFIDKTNSALFYDPALVLHADFLPFNT